MLAAVAAILAAAYLTTRWLGLYSARKTGFRPRAASGRMRVVAQLAVGRGEQLELVCIGQRCYLIGVGAGGVSLLREFDPEESLELLARDGEDAAAPGFMDALKENLRKRK